MHKKWFRKLIRQRLEIALILILQIAFLAYVLFNTSVISNIASVIFRTISLAVVLYIISKKDKGAYKTTWIVVITTFPIFGGLLYLMFNTQITTRPLKGKMEQLEAKRRSYIDEFEHIDGEVSQLQTPRYLQNYMGFPLCKDCKTEYYTPGEEMLEPLLSALEKAEKYIFLEYFIIQEGKMWNSVLDVLKRKAASGVKVRLLYDDFGCFFLLPRDYPKTLASYGIDCKVFNPFRPVLTIVQNNRDHRKIAVVDGKVAFTGGINLADEYINEYEKHGHWKDSAIRVEGSGAWSLTLMFLQMWETVTRVDEDYGQYKPELISAESANGYILPYCDSPVDYENVSEHVYMQMINNARDYLYIATPYLIIDDSMVSALTLAAKSGVDVRIITPHKWDKWFVHMTTRSYYRQLLAEGVKIYEYTPGFIHSKTFVSDDSFATVGTVNMDFRSMYLHYECGSWMYKTDTVMQVKRDFLETLDQCHMVTKKDCKTNPIIKIVQDILRVFAPLM